jgi:hypothetical protein
MKTLKLNDPKVIAHNKARKSFYQDRAAKALVSEKIELPEPAIAALAEMAWRLEAGGLPTILPIAERTYRDIHNRVTNDAKSINKSIGDLVCILNKICVPTEMEIIDKLAEKGITGNEVSRVLNALGEVAAEMASDPIMVTRQGNTQKPRAAWILKAWELLSILGLSMRPAARVISKLFDGSDKDHESVYQTIRNASFR